MHFSGMVTQYGTLPTQHILNLSSFQNRNTWLVTVSMETVSMAKSQSR